jgi:hypothetical protein
MSFGYPSRAAGAAAFCIVALFGAACTRAIEGAMRHADKTLQFCDGEGWRSASAASGHP